MAVSDQPAPGVGARVTWLHVGGSALWTREGIVTAVDAAGVATVQPPDKRSRPVRVHVSRLRLQSRKTALTEIVEGVFGHALPAVEQE